MEEQKENLYEIHPNVKHRHRTSRLASIPYWMLAPALACLVLLIVVPFCISVYTSFTKLNQYTIGHWLQAPFVGFGNYVTALFQSNLLEPSALQSIGVSIAFSVVSTLFITPIAVAAALVVNRPFRGRGIVRAIFLVPYALPVYVTAILWRFLFMNGWGLVDVTLSHLHLASVNTYWLLGSRSFWALVITELWAAWPFVYVMVLAGLQGIPQELYEAAYVDGATVSKAFWKVTLPTLRPVLALALLLSTLNHFNNFPLPYVMFGTSPPASADVLPLKVYVTSFQTLNFGGGAATGVITLIIMAVPAIFYLRALRLGEANN